MGKTFGPYEVESLVRGLTLGNFEQRAEAAWELGIHEGDAVINALISRLADPDENTAVLMHVIASLDRIRSPRSRESLVQFGSQTSPATLHEERCRLHAMRAVERLDRD